MAFLWWGFLCHYFTRCLLSTQDQWYSHMTSCNEYNVWTLGSVYHYWPSVKCQGHTSEASPKKTAFLAVVSFSRKTSGAQIWSKPMDIMSRHQRAFTTIDLYSKVKGQGHTSAASPQNCLFFFFFFFRIFLCTSNKHSMKGGGGVALKHNM